MRVQELTKQYDGKTVVDGVSFAIPKGKVISLIGPNGAGKSTVMGMISRLIAHDSGLVDFEGKDIGKWKSKELSKRLAILTQSNNIQMKTELFTTWNWRSSRIASSTNSPAASGSGL